MQTKLEIWSLFSTRLLWLYCAVFVIFDNYVVVVVVSVFLF